MSHKGTSTFIMQRTSAVLLIPLVLWFLWSVIAHAGQDYAATRAWMGQLHNTILLGGLVTIGAFHMRIGMGEVIADYLRGTGHDIAQMANWAATIAAIALTWWALISL